jgi:class 3 adenylate cyclase
LVVERLKGDVKEFLAYWVAAKDEEDYLAGDVATPDPVELDDIEYDILVVSCDIVGHSSAEKHNQRRRVKEINAIVAASIAGYGRHRVIWLSGGDGGHVVFRDLAADGGGWWRAAVIDLIRRLSAWSAGEGRRLRVTGHAGQATHLPGADGRTQIVGDGINVAGWLLERGGPDGVVVSDPFRGWLEKDGPIDEVVFHEPRLLRDKTFVDQELLLMSLGDRVSQWYLPVNGDQAQLHRALELLAYPPEGKRRQGWEVILFAKRVMQCNKNDPEARQALGRLVREDLQCRTDDGRDGLNPFFADLDPTLLREVVESAELIYRCRGSSPIVRCSTSASGFRSW